MTDRENRPIIGGAGGNTSGTGGADLSGPGEGVGAGVAGSGAGDEGELETERRASASQDQSDEGSREGLSAGDESVDDAIGGSAPVSGTGGSPALSGRNSSEGNAAIPFAPDPGDPGGMGGAGVSSGNPHGRPPGGLSPIDPQESSED